MCNNLQGYFKEKIWLIKFLNCFIVAHQNTETRIKINTGIRANPQVITAVVIRNIAPPVATTNRRITTSITTRRGIIAAEAAVKELLPKSPGKLAK